MNYLISNIHRSGSSMMMRCLTYAGMMSGYDEGLDNSIGLNIQDDYHPNPNGFYQCSFSIQNDELKTYTNKVIKYPFRNLNNLPKGQYKLCFLKRNPAEIELSMQKFTPYMSWGKDAVVLEFYDLIINNLLDKLKSREDINLTVLNYADIIDSPLEQFTKLVYAGWPIDPIAASSFVDSNLYRNKV